MSDSYVPTGEFLGSQQAAFGRFADASNSVTESNTRAETAIANMTTADVRDAFLGVEHDEQLSAFAELMEAQTGIPYDELVARCGQNVAWQKELQARREAAARGDFDEAIRIHADAKLAIQLNERSAGRVLPVAERAAAAAIEQRQAGLRAEEYAATSVSRKLAVTLGSVGVLPIPTLLTAAERMDAFNRAQALQPTGEQDEAVATMDIFTVEPRQLSDVQLAERVKHNYPDEVFRGASEFIALLLAEDPGRALSFEEVGAVTYSNVSDDVAAGRARGLLRAAEEGRISIIPKILAERGLKLERGERVPLDPATGMRKRGRSLTVFRAVPIVPVADTDGK